MLVLVWWTRVSLYLDGVRFVSCWVRSLRSSCCWFNGRNERHRSRTSPCWNGQGDGLVAAGSRLLRRGSSLTGDHGNWRYVYLIPDVDGRLQSWSQISHFHKAPVCEVRSRWNKHHPSRVIVMCPHHVEGLMTLSLRWALHRASHKCCVLCFVSCVTPDVL